MNERLVREGTGTPRTLDKNHLLTILQRNNKQVFDLLEQRNNESPGSTSYDQIESELTSENGEALMLMKLIRYLDFETEFEDLK
ncbi:hypothetical protein [Halobacillus aidingensis]|uniref:Uncharacterized protein n=1 Tax=Halobacillus aidingensis TaxID=240303 RepID=A0A1H0MF18_HALAD|nr:hypothetical protein [Halobacillus aidingensis]SDO78921.1 hypothetical protein SAMN05421677_10814 [Halobacillus aidingensis]